MFIWTQTPQTQYESLLALNKLRSTQNVHELSHSDNKLDNRSKRDQTASITSGREKISCGSELNSEICCTWTKFDQTQNRYVFKLELD